MTKLLVGETLNSESMTSLQIAEVTGKNHSHIMRDIRNLLDQIDKEGESIFGLSSYKSEQNKDLPMYHLTKKGCLLLASGYDAKLRLAIINRWEELENLNKPQLPQTFAQALMLAAKQAELIENQQKILAEQAPKVLFASAVETSKQSILIGELAKLITQNGYTIGQNKLFNYLRVNNYLCSFGEKYNQPRQRFVEQGLFEIKKTTINKPDGSILVTSTVKVTGKGQIYFVNKFLKK